MVHEPGLEFFHHYSFYPDDVPVEFEMNPETSAMDISLEALETVKKSNCKQWSMSKYIGEETVSLIFSSKM